MLKVTEVRNWICNKKRLLVCLKLKSGFLIKRKFLGSLVVTGNGIVIMTSPLKGECGWVGIRLFLMLMCFMFMSKLFMLKFLILTRLCNSRLVLCMVFIR